MPEDNPLFKTENQLTNGLKRYYAKLRQDKSALHNAVERLEVPINETIIKEISFILTSQACMNDTVNTLRKIHNLNGFEIVTIAGIAYGQYSWSLMAQRLFYFAGGKLQTRRIQKLCDEGYLLMIVNPPHKKKVYVTEKGMKVADHLAVELHHAINRLGIIKG